MKHLKKIVIATLAVSTIGIGATAYAQRDNAGHRGRIIERITEKLELDDNQNAALNTLADEMHETRQLMKGEGDTLKTQMSELLGAETFDQGKALAMINGRAAALQANAPELVAAAAVFFDGLSAEQKIQIQTFAEKRHGKFGRHGHRD